MKYVIYEMVQLDFLQKTEPDGYYMKTRRREVLEILDESGVYSDHNTYEEAMKEISDNSGKLSSKKLTILPVIDIGWDGAMPSKL
jgi:hypothetical protein